MSPVIYSLRSTLFCLLKSLIADTPQLDLLYEFDPAIPDEVLGDPKQLCEAITYTVNNAIKFAPGHPTQHDPICLACQLVALDEISASIEICLEIPGICAGKDELMAVFNKPSLTNEHIKEIRIELEAGVYPRVYFIAADILRPRGVDCIPNINSYGYYTTLCIGTLVDWTNIAQFIDDQYVQPIVARNIRQVANESDIPTINAIITDSCEIVEKLRALDHLQHVPTVLLSSTTQRLSMAWCSENLIFGQITSQPSRHELAAALGKSLEANAFLHDRFQIGIYCDILLAEDNKVNQRIASKLLRKYGHSVHIVENGELAINAVKRRHEEGKPFDVILMDISMPIMGGLEATGCIRAYEAEQQVPRTPIIGVTAHSMIGDLDICYAAGMDGRVMKPLRRVVLISTILGIVLG